MKITIKRILDNGKATIGLLFVDNIFECFTLEDEKRKTKVKGETRIWEGTYDVVFRTEGKHHARYSKKYKDKHYGMLHILNVPQFQYILIHIGNTEKDTDGCLLVGDTANSSFTVGSSTIAYERLYAKVAKALLNGEKVTITFEDKEPVIKNDGQLNNSSS